MNYTVPPLSDCTEAGIEPFEFQCLVAFAVAEEKSKGGIILAADTRDANQFRADHARLVAISPAAFSYHAWPDGVRKPQVGDEVFVPKFSGAEVIGKDGKSYKLVPDRDIKAIIERAAP